MSTYTQLTYEQRYQLSALKKAGHTQSDIAEYVGTSEATISRELRRNRCATGYDPAVAHEKAVARRQQKFQFRITAEEWQLVEEKLRQDWSPEQVAERLKREHEVQISHEWIYQHIYADKAAGGDLHKHLRCQKPYRKRAGGQERHVKLRNRLDIDKRPELVEQRARIGDCEADTVVGKGRQRYLVTVMGRKSRFTLSKSAESKRATVVREAIVELLAPYQEQTLMVTFDNRKEVAEHEAIAEALGADTYVAHPSVSWECGTHENTHGLLRQ